MGFLRSCLELNGPSATLKIVHVLLNLSLPSVRQHPISCSFKTYFFYSILSFLHNTNVSLSIIHIHSNKILISLALLSLSQTRYNPHSHRHQSHLSQDRHRNPHKPITPESQRKPVKKKRETNPVKNPFFNQIRNVQTTFSSKFNTQIGEILLSWTIWTLTILT